MCRHHGDSMSWRDWVGSLFDSTPSTDDSQHYTQTPEWYNDFGTSQDWQPAAETCHIEDSSYSWPE